MVCRIARLPAFAEASPTSKVVRMGTGKQEKKTCLKNGRRSGPGTCVLMLVERPIPVVLLSVIRQR